MPMPRRRRAPHPVPDLHVLMMGIAVFFCLLGATGYGFAPADRKDFFRDLAGSSVIFLFGKFTNGWKKPESIEESDAKPDADGE